MTAFRFRHILFDLGGTLMHSKENWSPIHARADRALEASLNAQGISLQSSLFRERLHQYYEQRDKDHCETTYHLVLRELLNELGYPQVAESVIRSALDALYSVTQKNWALEDDARQALQTLKSHDYRMGILSNAGDDKDVQDLIEQFGVRDYFDFVTTSAACFYRKPHPRSFELALAQWNIAPEEAVMVGDTLEADIRGAQSLNMRTVWITRRAECTEEEKRRIRPDVDIPSLEGLFTALEELNAKR